MEWVTFCKRTEDPKLAYMEHRLDEMGIAHRRNGESRHAPILEVPADRHADAYALFNEVVDMADDGTPIRLDDIPDDDPMFDEHMPGWQSGSDDDDENTDPCDIDNRPGGFNWEHQGADF